MGSSTMIRVGYMGNKCAEKTLKEEIWLWVGWTYVKEVWGLVEKCVEIANNYSGLEGIDILTFQPLLFSSYHSDT